MRLIKSYRNLQKPVKATLWFAFSNFFQKGIAFLLIPIFTRFMLPEQYGQYSVFQSWYSVLVIVVTLSLGKNVFHKGMMEFEDQKEQYTASMAGLGMLSTLVFTMVYLVAPAFWNEITGLSTRLTLLMFVEFFFFSTFDCWSSRKRFDFDYSAVVSLSLAVAALTAIVSVPAVISAHSGVLARRARLLLCVKSRWVQRSMRYHSFLFSKRARGFSTGDIGSLPFCLIFP